MGRLDSRGIVAMPCAEGFGCGDRICNLLSCGSDHPSCHCDHIALTAAHVSSVGCGHGVVGMFLDLWFLHKTWVGRDGRAGDSCVVGSSAAVAAVCERAARVTAGGSARFLPLSFVGMGTFVQGRHRGL